jgi:hypothetical protein
MLAHGTGVGSGSGKSLQRAPRNQDGKRKSLLNIKYTKAECLEEKDRFIKYILEADTASMIHLLENTEVDVNDTSWDEYGYTPLMAALDIDDKQKRNEVIACLVKFGADKYIKNFEQYTTKADLVVNTGINFHHLLAKLYYNQGTSSGFHTNEYKREKMFKKLEDKGIWQKYVNDKYNNIQTAIFYLFDTYKESSHKLFSNKKNVEAIKKLDLTSLRDCKTDSEFLTWMQKARDNFASTKNNLGYYPHQHGQALVTFDYIIEKLEQKIGAARRQILLVKLAEKCKQQEQKKQEVSSKEEMPVKKNKLEIDLRSDEDIVKEFVKAEIEDRLQSFKPQT